MATYTIIWQIYGYNVGSTNKCTTGSVYIPADRYYSYLLPSDPVRSISSRCIFIIRKEENGVFNDIIYFLSSNNTLTAIKTNFDNQSNPYEVLWTKSFSWLYLQIELFTLTSILGVPYILAMADNTIYMIHAESGSESEFYQSTPKDCRDSTFSDHKIFQDTDGDIYTTNSKSGGAFGSTNGTIRKISQNGIKQYDSLIWTDYNYGWYGALNSEVIHAVRIHSSSSKLFITSLSSTWGVSGLSTLTFYKCKVCRMDKLTGAATVSTVDLMTNTVPWNPYGIYYNEDSHIIYVLTSNGVKTYDGSFALQSQHISSSSVTGGWAIESSSRLYYRAGSTLYAIDIDSYGIITESFKTTILPSGSHSADLIIDSDGKIIVASNTNLAGVSNVHIFEVINGNAFLLVDSFKIRYNGGINITPSIGSNGLLYLAGNSVNCLYAYGSNAAPTTTTTTTTPSPVTTTTTTGTGSTTTTTTTTPTTTTTTTTPAPLSIVKTTQFSTISADNVVPIQTSNASDDNSTQNSLLAQSFSFGTIAPNQTSKTMIFQLNVPRVKAITNIKIGIISVSNITFTSEMIGITKSTELRDDIDPADGFYDGYSWVYYFDGINEDESPTSAYNISVANKNDHTSEYVYLNMKLPNDQSIGEGLIRFKWFFDYA